MTSASPPTPLRPTSGGERPTSEGARTQALAHYLTALDERRGVFPQGEAISLAPPPREALPKRLLKRLLSHERRLAIRWRWELIHTDLIRRSERRRAEELARRSPLRLHLASGRYVKRDWVNIDLAGYPVELRWNLKRPLPFEPGSVDAIFHEHLLEHLTLSQGLEVLRSCHALLKPGGVLRVGVPDAGAYLASYREGGSGVIEAVRPGRPTLMLAVQEVFYLFDHQAMYDAETLTLFCRAAGFREAEAREFGDSRLESCPDSTHRRAETLYVEAVK